MAKYQAKLESLLNKFDTTCDELATLARNNEIHDDHVTFAQDVIAKRVARLRRELAFKPEVTEIKLPDIGGKKDDKPKPHEKPAESGKETKPDAGSLGGLGNQS